MADNMPASGRIEGRAADGFMLRKSRTGCVTCRARRVKCDEVKPVCGNCRRRFVDIDTCEYRSSAVRRTATRRSIQPVSQGQPAASITNLSLHPPAVEQSGPWRSLELYLMHHYTRTVAATMSPCGGPWNMWTDTIPRISFDNEVLLNPLLALSAMHLHAHASTDSRLSLAAARYMDRALVKHREAIPDFHTALTEPLWLSAVMVAHLAWLAGHYRAEGQSYEMPTQYWIVRDSTTGLFVRQFDRLRSLGYAWVGWEKLPDDIRTKDLAEDERQQMLGVEAELRTLYKGFGVEEPEEDASAQTAYDEVRDYVLMLYRAYFSGMQTRSLRRLFGSITIRCRLGLRDKLEAHDPLMMALMAHFIVLLKGQRLPERWWLNGKGQYEVVASSVLGMRSLMPQEYLWAMDWPCRVLNGQIKLRRATEHPGPDDEAWMFWHREVTKGDEVQP